MDGMRWIQRNHTSPSALSSALASFLLFAEVKPVEDHPWTGPALTGLEGKREMAE